MAPDQAAAVGADLVVAARASALAVEALAAASAAASAAEEADAVLRAVGVVDAFAPATFSDLEVASVEALLFTSSAPAPDPGLVAGWWARLPTAEQDVAITADPGLVGALDGLPVAARDRANRILLAGALADRGSVEGDHARTVAGALARTEAGGQQVQLWSLDLRQGLAAVALGDLDTADDIGVLVPGVGTDLADLGGQLGDAADVAAATRRSAPVGATVATVAWLGYLAPPDVLAGSVRLYATVGGPRLDAALAGLDASRRAGSAPEPRTTVLAHSYGTEVVDVAAGDDGELDADAVVLLGSPGMTGTAAHLEVPEVYQALAPSDIIRDLGPLAWLDRAFTALTGPLGQLTDAAGYGAVPLPTDDDQGHSDYFEPGHPTLAALGGVVAGTSWR
jgi:hypothetical protein